MSVAQDDRHASVFPASTATAWAGLRRAVREAHALGAKFRIVGADIEVEGDLPDELRAALPTELLYDYLGAEAADNEALDFLDGLGVRPVLVTDLADVQAVLQELNGKVLSLDIETGPPDGRPAPVHINADGSLSTNQEKPDEVGVDPHRSCIQCLQLYAGTDIAYIFRGEALRDVISSAWLYEQHLVVHSAGFEIAFLQRHGTLPPTQVRHPIEDTQQAVGLLHGVRAGRSLADASRLTFGTEPPKALQTSCWSAARLSQGQLAYAAIDAVSAFALWQEMHPALEAKARFEAYRLQRDAVPAVADMRSRGLGFDPVEHSRQVEAWSRDYADARRKYEELISEAPPITSAQLASWVAQVAGDRLAQWPRTKTGVLSTRASHLKRLTLDVPTAKLVLDIQAKKTLLENFGNKLQDYINSVTRRLHCSYHIGGAKAGRFTASQPNLQQLPSKRAMEFKQAIVAEPGYLLVGGDWSQIELRAAAFVSGDRALTAQFEEGRDLHSEMASLISGVPIEQLTRAQRDAAKAVNFGAIYGIGARSLAENVFAEYGVNMTEIEAQTALDTFFRKYPTLRQWMFDHYRKCRNQGFVEIGVGRVVEAAWEFEGTLRFTQCCNLPIQGAAADAMLRALPLVFYRLRGIRGGLVATVHDELLLEVAEADAEAARQILEKAMIEAFEVTFPGAPTTKIVEVKVGKTWKAVK